MLKSNLQEYFFVFFYSNLFKINKFDTTYELFETKFEKAINHQSYVIFQQFHKN